jgi:hypothetical protein
MKSKIKKKMIMYVESNDNYMVFMIIVHSDF